MTENVPLNFSIDNIKVIHCLLEFEKSDTPSQDLHLKTDAEVLHVPEQSLIKITVFFQVTDPQSKHTMASLKVLNTFSVASTEENTITNTDSKNTLISPKLINHFLLLAVSHTRGIFSQMTKGTPLEDLMVPILRNKDLVS